MTKCVCVVCGKEFEAVHKSLCCSDCKIGQCVVCGKQFNRKHPYTQKTCSITCRSEYIKQSGIGKTRAAAGAKTKLDRYGTLDASVISKDKIPDKVCPLCGKEFKPETFRQVYCKGPHYGPCPVCSKPTIIKDISIGPQACSQECRVKAIAKTCVERYGDAVVMNSPYGRELGKQTSLRKWGVSHPSKSKEVQEKREATMKIRYGVAFAIQNEEIQKKVRETSIQRYGVPVPSMAESVKAKIQATSEALYGGIGMASPELRERIISTNRQKYGVDYVTERPGFYSEVRKTMLSKYGHPYYTQSDESRSTRIFDPSKYEEWRAFSSDCKTYIESHYTSPPTIYVLCHDLGVTDTTIYDILVRDNCQHMINHTKQSTMEYEIIEMLSHYIPADRIIYNSRKIIPPQEVDIFLPDYNLAIECNPTVTHNSSFIDPWGGLPKSPNYHLNKTIACDEVGVALLHVFGYEWSSRRPVIESMLLNRLGKTEKTTYGRDTHVVTVPSHVARQFMEANHRQGFTGSAVHLGLEDSQGNLLAVMSFSKTRPTLGKTTSTADSYELTRFANALNSHVIGGASKLFKHFVSTYSPEMVISYSDRAHTTGNMYEKLGFCCANVSDPGYVWVNMKDDSYKTRVSCQKSNLPKMFNEPDMDIINQTEKQIMESHGYAQVFDSGVIRWEWCRSETT